MAASLNPENPCIQPLKGFRGLVGALTLALVLDHAMRNRRRLEMYVFPFLVSVPLAQITQGDLLAVLRKLDPGKSQRPTESVVCVPLLARPAF